MEQAEREIWNDLLSERKDWKDTLHDARIVCSYPEFRLILHSEERAKYAGLYFFKHGLKMAYKREGYADSWIDLLLKLVDIMAYRGDDFQRVEQMETYQEFKAWLEAEEKKGKNHGKKIQPSKR